MRGLPPGPGRPIVDMDMKHFHDTARCSVPKGGSWLLDASMLWVGAPCLSRGSDASASRKKSQFHPLGFSPGFPQAS
jgi:hypothetical protein